MQKQTIALIDDDRNILTSLSIALEKEGFKVQTYIDGESALIGLTRTPPDLAIVDIKMPKMDGEELLKKLRKKTSLPVIFLTSKDEEVDELDEVIEILAHELWRKTVRVDKETSVPYYNLSESYIEAELYNHLYNISKSDEECDEEERVELTPLFDCDEDGEENEPRDTSYGGFWYRRGKKSQEMLMGFYEHMGFVEAPEVHKEWGCFSNIPYPTMMKVL